MARHLIGWAQPVRPVVEMQIGLLAGGRRDRSPPTLCYGIRGA